jgi:hypothetical protein
MWLWQEDEESALLRYDDISLWNTSLVTVLEPKYHYNGLDDPMTIFVKTITGRTISINDVKPSDSIYQVRTKIQEKEGVPPEYGKLVFAGMKLLNEKSVSSYNIRNESTLHMLMGQLSEIERDPSLRQLFSYQYSRTGKLFHS